MVGFLIFYNMLSEDSLVLNIIHCDFDDTFVKSCFGCKFQNGLAEALNKNAESAFTDIKTRLNQSSVNGFNVLAEKNFMQTLNQYIIDNSELRTIKTNFKNMDHSISIFEYLRHRLLLDLIVKSFQNGNPVAINTAFPFGGRLKKIFIPLINKVNEALQQEGISQKIIDIRVVDHSNLHTYQYNPNIFDIFCTNDVGSMIKMSVSERYTKSALMKLHTKAVIEYYNEIGIKLNPTVTLVDDSEKHCQDAKSNGFEAENVKFHSEDDVDFVASLEAIIKEIPLNKKLESCNNTLNVSNFQESDHNKRIDSFLSKIITASSHLTGGNPYCEATMKQTKNGAPLIPFTI